MQRVLLLVLVMLGAGALAGPVVEVRVGAGIDEAQKGLEAALLAQGFTPERTLDISAGIHARGVSFMPYKVTVLKPDAGIVAAVQVDPSAAALLPPTVYLYSPKANETVIGTADIRAWLPLMKLPASSQEALKITFAKLETALSHLGSLQKGSGEVPNGPLAMLYRIPGSNLADVIPFLDSGVRDKNLNLVGGLQLSRHLGDVRQFWVCRLDWPESLFRVLPQAGIMAPCRMFAYQQGKDVIVGAMDPLLALAFGKLDDKVLKEMRGIRTLIDELLTELGAEPIK